MLRNSYLVQRMDGALRYVELQPCVYLDTIPVGVTLGQDNTYRKPPPGFQPPSTRGPAWPQYWGVEGFQPTKDVSLDYFEKITRAEREEQVADAKFKERLDRFLDLSGAVIDATLTLVPMMNLARFGWYAISRVPFSAARILTGAQLLVQATKIANSETASAGMRTMEEVYRGQILKGLWKFAKAVAPGGSKIWFEMREGVIELTHSKPIEAVKSGMDIFSAAYSSAKPVSTPRVQADDILQEIHQFRSEYDEAYKKQLELSAKMMENLRLILMMAEKEKLAKTFKDDPKMLQTIEKAFPDLAKKTTR